MRAYDPRTDPDAAGWLATEESERIQAVLVYHKRARIRVPSEGAQATIHVIVENQLALAVPEAVDTLARLQREGLNRHDAVHAIGSVLAEHIYELLKQGPAEDVVSNAAYLDGLKKLTTAGGAEWLTWIIHEFPVTPTRSLPAPRGYPGGGADARSPPPSVGEGQGGGCSEG